MRGNIKHQRFNILPSHVVRSLFAVNAFRPNCFGRYIPYDTSSVRWAFFVGFLWPYLSQMSDKESIAPTLLSALRGLNLPVPFSG